MANYKFTIQYDGRKYNGWQKQGNTTTTIQGKLEEILSKMFEMEIEVVGSGRTDAGVHALGQVANAHIDKFVDNETFRDELNEHLPKDIRIVDVAKVDDRFHARLNATGKKYSYRIDNGAVSDPFTRKYCTRVEKQLDINKMKEAASLLIGEHDFTAFSTTAGKKKSKVRTIYSLELVEDNGKISIDVTGNGFLYNMVRIIAGTLIEVGLGKKTISNVREALESMDRSKAGITAPPTGLFLVEVNYDK